MELTRQQDDVTEEAVVSAWLWSASRRVYIWRSNGRAVSFERVEAWIERAIERAERNLRRIGQAYIDGQINSAEWALQAGAEIKNLHRSMAMLANGGKAQMNNARWGRLGGKMQRQFAYFARFAAQVEGIDRSELGEKFLRRLGSYAQAGRNTYWHAARALAAETSTMMERNVLGFTKQSCSQCLSETDRGWVSSGQLSSPGDRLCGSGCRCHIEFKSAAAVSEEAA